MAQHQDTDEATRPSTGHDTGHRVVLEMPAAPEYVALSRLTIAALANRFGLDQAVVADLKLAVTEACSLFIEPSDIPQASGGIRVEFGVGDERWTITVTGPLPGHGLAGSGDQAGLGLVVIEALADDVETLTEGPTGMIRFGRSVR
ncbi:MAG: ATP-binding protein [Thermoleophilia bacterium]